MFKRETEQLCSKQPRRRIGGGKGLSAAMRRRHEESADYFRGNPHKPRVHGCRASVGDARCERTCEPLMQADRACLECRLIVRAQRARRSVRVAKDVRA